MNTVATGHRAETAVAVYLERRGYQILDKNWRTRYCEIDVIACKNQTIYFVEVKYRSTPAFGTPLEYITAAKLRQMSFAARLWVTKHSWRGNYQLVAAAVTGSDFTVTDFIELA